MVSSKTNTGTASSVEIMVCLATPFTIAPPIIRLLFVCICFNMGSFTFSRHRCFGHSSFLSYFNNLPLWCLQFCTSARQQAQDEGYSFRIVHVILLTFIAAKAMKTEVREIGRRSSERRREKAVEASPLFSFGSLSKLCLLLVVINSILSI